MAEHLGWLEHHPTPDASRWWFECACEFVSVEMRKRYAPMYLEMHETGRTGLPGERVGQEPLSDEIIDQIMTLLEEADREEDGATLAGG